MLPRIPVTRGAEKWRQSAFGGLDRRTGARSRAVSGGGLALSVSEMTNMGGQDAPLLASRPPRRSLDTVRKPNGLLALDGAWIVADGTALRAGETALAAVTDTEKTLLAFQGKVLVWPDRLLVGDEPEAADNVKSLSASFTATGLVFGDGTYAGENAKANCVTTGGEAPFPFRVGDAVTITGCVSEPANNKTPIVREISDDGKTLRFYENTFTIPEGESSVTETGSVTLARTAPELDFLCVHENRVWGCRGDTIRCSKLGDPFNWNVFDGLSTDAWSAETGTPGAFTGCASYMGYPVFFKEDRVFKVYGSRPSNFEVLGAATLGVLPGASRSLAVAGETLFYLSRAGFVAYRGGFPACADAALGPVKHVRAAAGSDGTRYFVSAETPDGAKELLVYDTAAGLWRREDDSFFRFFASAGGCVAGLRSDGALLALSGASAGAEEAAFASSVTFADLDFGSFGGKYPVRVWLRAETPAPVGQAAPTPLVLSVRHDGGLWREAASLTTGGAEKTACLALPIRRCDRFSLKLACAAGAWRLWSIGIEAVPGYGSRK